MRFAVDNIAVHYAELGDFEQAMRINESVSAEDWRTEAFAEIAAEYWKQDRQEDARRLFQRIADMPLPKDVIYIWGDVAEKMAQSEQFDLALEVVAGMAAVVATTADDQDDGAHQVAIQFAKLGLYGRAVQLANQAGEFFGDISLVQIASEALRKNDRNKALEIAAQAESRIAKRMKGPDFEPVASEAERLSEIAVLYSRLERRPQALALADLAFNTATNLGKPGERQRALES
jgi:tetratricopeptide (TPR) repeat protein